MIFSAPLPPPPFPGARYDPASEAALHAAISELRRALEPHVRLLRSFTRQRITDRDGAVWELLARAAGGADAVDTEPDTHPLACLDATNDIDGPAIRLVYGTIDDIPAASMSPGDAIPLIIPVSGTGVLFAGAEVASGIITSWEPASDTARPPDDYDASTGDGTIYRTLCSFDATGPALAIADNLGGSQWWQWCGGTSLWGT